MEKIIRDFKRHYHKVRKLIPEIADQGSFGLKINLQSNLLSASASTPSQEISIQFAVLMRRFLAQQSDLYYENIFKFLLENAPHIITREKQEEITRYIESMKRGPISIQINDKQMSAAEIYSLVSDGEYFQHDEKVSAYLKELSSAPIVGPLFLHQFYSYTLEGFYLISFLFGLVSVWKKEENEISESDLANPKCIYCLSSEKSFRSEEHIFPEALGNDEAVLPKGYVCDTCNNGLLSTLDSYLLEFEPIAFLQVQYVPYTKSGKLPKANFQNMMIERTRPNHIKITAKDKSGGISNKKDLGNGYFSWKINFRGKQMDAIRLGRSLYKIALGFIAFDQGHDVALSSRFDAARDYINGKTDFPNDLLISGKTQPHPNLRVAHKDMEPGCPFVVDIFGILFMFNLEKDPRIAPIEEIIELGFQKFPLGEK